MNVRHQVLQVITFAKTKKDERGQIKNSSRMKMKQKF